MFQRVASVPARYYELAILNVGLIIALYKDMSLIAIMASLAFVALAIAPIAIMLGILSPPPYHLINEEIL